MKRLSAVLYLLFLLWLFLFPPWSIGPRSPQYAADSIAGSCRRLDHDWWDQIPASCADLGHHWRFAVPRFQQTLTANDDLYWTLSGGPHLHHRPQHWVPHVSLLRHGIRSSHAP